MNPTTINVDSKVPVMKPLIALVALATLSTAASAAEPSQPYAGLETRSIKALSEQQIADLQAGRGMGLALAAELNGYPGPVHVLEFAVPLALTSEQRDRIQQLYEEMKQETIAIGTRLVAEEARLDREFAQQSITRSSLSEAMASIGETQGALRLVHLKYHLATVDVLNAHQMRRYAELRGYSDGRGPTHHPAKEAPKGH